MDQLGEIELAQFIREEIDRYVMRNKLKGHEQFADVRRYGAYE